MKRDLESFFADSASVALVSQVHESDYGSVYPDLEQYLQAPRTVKEVAEEFKVTQAKAKDWLAQGISEEKVIKMTRPVRYIASRQEKPGEQMQLDL